MLPERNSRDLQTLVFYPV